jgi:hypothetical protein
LASLCPTQVDAFEKQDQVGGFEGELRDPFWHRMGKVETPPLQALGIQHEAIVVVAENACVTPATREENKEVTTQRTEPTRPESASMPMRPSTGVAQR